MVNKLAFICFIFFYSFLVGQNDNTVLWRISGKNLSKPSYLFGTVHLKDKRIFFANDSISDYIRNCDMFASELHPDSLNALFFNTNNKNDTSDVFKKSFDNSEYEAIDKKLQNDVGLSLRQIKNKNYRLLKLLLNPIEEKKDDYPTFLDGYLMSIAKRMGKEIIGLENTNSHESGLNSIKSEENLKREIINLSKTVKNVAPLENIIKLYLAGDINKIQDNMSALSYEAQYDLIFQRNKIMANTIDSIIKNTTLFATFGSAHLAGDNGIIQLLKDMGYTLTPIFSSKKEYLSLNGLPQNFTTWKQISNSSFGFKYQLPGSPIAYKKEIILSDMQMYIDMTSGATYMVLPMAAAVDVSDKDKIFKVILESLQKKSLDNTIKLHQSINYNGIQGFEIEYKVSLKIDIKLRLFIENNILYMFIVSYSSNNSNTEEFDHFFNNISFFKPVGTDAYQYDNSKWGFSINLPSKPNEKTEYLNNNMVEMLTLRSSDNISGIQYVLQLSEAGVGRYFENDSLIINRMNMFLTENKSVTTLKDSAFIYNGSKCIQSIAKANDGSCIVNWSILKGFKLYNLMAIMPSTSLEKRVYEGVFNSINFTEFSYNDYKPNKAPIDTLLEFNLVKPFLKYEYKNSAYIDTLNPLYQSYDFRSGITYYIQKQEQSDYYFTTSDSVSWKKIENSIVSYNDTVLLQKDIKLSNIPAKEFVIKTKGNTSVIRYVILNFGKYSYQFYSYLPEQDLNGIYEYPYKNITYTGSYKPVVYSDTTAFRVLITDAFSNDTIKKEQSRSEFYKFDLTGNMFPQIKSILDSKNYPVDTISEYYFDVKFKLINKLNDLPDSMVFNYVVQKINNKDTEEKYLDSYAGSLAKIKTKAAYKELELFLKTKLAHLSEYSSVLYVAKDSLELASLLYPTLLDAFLKDTSGNYSLVNLTKNLLDSGLISYDMIIPFQEAIIKESHRYYYQKTNPKSIFESYFDENIAAIVNHSSNKTLIYEYYNEFCKSTNNWIAYYGAYYLLKNNQPVNSKLLNSLAKHPYFRNKMFEDFTEIKKMELFPVKYKNQLSLAESDVYNYAYSYDEIELISSEFLSKKNTQFNGKEAEFYFFKIKYSDDEGYYLGYAGPYYLGEELKISAEKTGILFDETYSKGMEKQYIFRLVE